MKLILYDEQGQELKRYASMKQASKDIGYRESDISVFLKHGYRFPNGHCIKKLNVADQTEIAIKEHESYGTTRANLERKYKVNKPKLRKAIETIQQKKNLMEAYNYWNANPNTSIRIIADMHDLSVYKLSKYIANELTSNKRN
jgi:hypothetical protein